MPYGSLEEALTFGFEMERQYRCESHDDHNASASVNAVSGFFFCYACGHKGKVDPNTIEITAEGLSRYTEKVAKTLYPEEKYTESWLSTFDATGPGPYWSSRFSVRSCRAFRLGSAKDVATYPMRNNAGRVLGIVSRDLTGERPAKYLYPFGVKTSDYLMDYHRVESDTVVLVEGMSDVVAVHDTGHRHVTLGCYGARLSHAQAMLLRKYHPTRILTAFDRDEAGQRAHWEVVQKLGWAFQIEQLWWTGYKDLAEIPLSERTAMLDAVLGKRYEPVTLVD